MTTEFPSKDSKHESHAIIKYVIEIRISSKSKLVSWLLLIGQPYSDPHNPVCIKFGCKNEWIKKRGSKGGLVVSITDCRE